MVQVIFKEPHRQHSIVSVESVESVQDPPPVLVEYPVHPPVVNQESEAQRTVEVRCSGDPRKVESSRQSRLHRETKESGD